MRLEKTNYSNKDLSPVMSEDTLKYHKDGLAKDYFKNFNSKDGDHSFNEAGAFLHNIFFSQFKKPEGDNKPSGASLEFINKHFSDFKALKEEMKAMAMSIQGSGWVYLSKDGSIKIIKNHQKKEDIALLIDWWEHAWSLDYKKNKEKYFDNIWKIIDWNVISNLLSRKKANASFPFEEKILSKDMYKRRFSSDASQEDLIWHRDREDRYIEIFSHGEWMFQFEDKLPFKLSSVDNIFIEKGVYHRLIKGSEDLLISVHKKNRSNISVRAEEFVKISEKYRKSNVK